MIHEFHIINTEDKSDTILSKKFNETYHSTHGALNESEHVFIQSGLLHVKHDKIKIFEVGFGTGLNAILTQIEAINKNITIDYRSIELYPLSLDLIQQLNFRSILSPSDYNLFIDFHRAEWNKKIKFSSNFELTKINADFNQFDFSEKYDLIYFDAFSPETQPKLWSISNFTKIFDALNKGGVLTTYSSKGLVKDNLRRSGFNVKRLPGPKGKRHILRAIKE